MGIDVSETSKNYRENRTIMPLSWQFSTKSIANQTSALAIRNIQSLHRFFDEAPQEDLLRVKMGLIKGQVRIAI
jgi:hypothetical protein